MSFNSTTRTHLSHRYLLIQDVSPRLKRRLVDQFQQELNDRNIVVKFRRASKFRAVAIGYYQRQFWHLDARTTVSKLTETLFRALDTMPLRQNEIASKRELGIFTSDYSGRQKPENLCFPTNPKSRLTQHCFSDSTHHTCCALGPKSREYSIKSGNPIGSAAETVTPVSTSSSREVRPWCTCSGSQVCQYYAQKHRDGTRIIFMYNVHNKAVYYNVPSHLESTMAQKFNIAFHRTPGVTFPQHILT